MRHIALVGGAQTIAETCDGFICTVAGTITVTDELGVANAYPCAAGLIIPFRARTFDVASGTFIVWYV